MGSVSSLIMDLVFLTILFFIVAFFYSMVGFGGGSSYIALLILFSTPYLALPKIALTCNLIVVSGGLIHSLKSKNFSFRFLLPFILTSVPLAYVGGKIPIDENTFRLILGVCLLIAGLKMLFFKKSNQGYKDHLEIPPTIPSLILGSGLGLISGIVGVGGGIFLSPLLFLFKWGNPNKIAATASGFIFFNSISGLIGQFQKNGNIPDFVSYWPLFIAVLIGGQMGSYLSNKKLPQRRIEVFTSFLVILVSSRLLMS
ncbi:MAG: sulfite exporter TauE/SafE family protein [Epsilonproteobacteria bacterium]|nr:MAG: sulfite exporter TauE/SafE family protein [Campylobacterota bacterium]RLA67682.1 MAG: sulfite exporter TauE/SafE family protein [Campylobacterota bacterium]